MEKQKRIFTLPKNIFFLGITSFLNDFSSEMVYSIFPAFFTHVLKAGATSLGIVEGFSEAISNIFKAYSGNLSDKFQRRKSFVVWGYALSTLTRPFYILTSTVAGVFGLRFLDRLGKGMRDAPRDSIISLSTPSRELGRSFGYHRAMDTAGAIFGPLTAYFVLSHYPLRFDIVFITAFVVGIMAIGTLAFIKDVKNNIQPNNDGVFKSFKKHSTRFKFFLLSVFVLSIGNIPIAILLLKTESIGLAIASIPLFYMVYNISFSGFSITGGNLSDNFGARKTLMIGYLFLIFSYIVFIYVNTSVFLVIGFLLLGIFSAMTDGVVRSLASQLSTEDLRGGALGLTSASIGFGSLVAGIGGGFLWQNFGPSVALITASLVVASGIFLFSLALINGTHFDKKNKQNY